VSAQQTIAHYRIVSRLGAGGMGEVWRATDTKLGRDVALKVLPEAFAADPDRMARFTREAQVLASLNHPNIAAIYGVEDRALVMELVEGPTLAERIAQGAMPLDEALPVAKQIAEALDYAHERGVVHRDLKPANVKITPEGRVKVLDFGLAKALAGEPAAMSGDRVNSPTLTMGATLGGMILGTAAYMAPEQARGQSVDRRADIWAFGVVLYEMVTGRQLFGGPTVSDTLAAVLKGELDLSAAPLEVRPVLERCLRRDARLRWRSIGDVLVTLEEGVKPAPAAAPERRSAAGWIAAAVLGVALLITGAFLWRATRPVDHPLTRLSVDLGPEAMTGLNTTVAISPDGRRLVFPARGADGKQLLATRLLDQTQPTLLPGTEGGFDPFFSPDSQWIGFFASGQLKKISFQGGVPVALCTFPGNPQGGSWGEDGDIVFGAVFRPLHHLPAAGGPPQVLDKMVYGLMGHRWPQVLPGGETVLFTATTATGTTENADIEAVSLKTGQVRVLQHGGYYGRYVPSGHLVYLHQGVLFGVGFDLARLEVRGRPTPLLEDLAANPVTGGGQFDLSGSGTLVYLAGKAAAQKQQVAWLDSSGRMQPLLRTPGVYLALALSPDGRELAFQGKGGDIYVHSLERDTTSPLTFDGNGGGPVWTPDGKHIAFGSQYGGFSLSWIRSDGSGGPLRLLENRSLMLPWSFSRDGRRLAYTQGDRESGPDIWTLPLDLSDPDHPKAGKPELFLGTPASETFPMFSPDGRWIAYRSNETGNNEIFVRPFPARSGGKWQVSVGGGLFALWSKNGSELFYETGDHRIMVMDYTSNGSSFVPGKARLWSDQQIAYQAGVNLDVAPDGKRFAVLTAPETPAGEKGTVHVTMLENFFDEVKRRIP
jgi:serine/threonine-protein kinase